MTIASELALLQTNLTAAYTSCNNKGATIPVNQNFDNLASCIDTIPTGGTTTYYGCDGTTFIGEVDANGVLQAPYYSSYLTNIVFTGVKDIAQTGLTGKFNNEATTSGTLPTAYTRGRTRLIKSLSFPDLTSITGAYAIFGICQNQTALESISFPELQTINARNAMTYAFSDCTSLTSVSFPKLETVSGTDAMNYAFRRCTSLANLYLGSLTGNINGRVLDGVTGCTVHLPTDYAGTCNLGGTNTAYVYDL